MRESLEAIIIDDNPADARILSRYLEELSLWEVSFEVVSKGEDAMSRTKEKDFDVAFVDYQLGKETGIDIIRSLKESGCHMGFVLLTGMSSEGVILEALREGAEDYIAKDNLSVESLDRCIRHIMKRKEAEEALIESEERFRTMFDQAAVGIALIDMDGKWIRVNQKLLGIVGYSFEELKSFSFLDLTYRDDWTALLRGVESLRRGKLSTFTMEKRHILSDGAISWTNVTISLMRGDRGKASYYLTVIEDINKRKQTEMALRKSEANLVYAQQIAQLGNWVWDIITDIHHWSNEIFRIFGMIPQQIDPSFESFMEVVHPDDREIVKASIDKALSDHVCFNIEHRIILPDGKIRIVVERGDVFYGENGEALQMISTVQDITKRKETEESLRLSAKVLDSTSEGILITDRNANILDVNDSFTRITGYSPEEVIGNNPRLMKSGKHDTNFYKSMWDSLKNDGFWQGEIWDRRKSGEIYPKWMSINEVQDDSGEVTHYVAIFSDITVRKLTEDRLHQLAHYDTLTGLPNRVLFHDRLQQAIMMSERNGKPVALMFLDLDRFKNINDTLGHPMGDELLIQVARRLTHCVRTTDTVARLGGDEFTIILTELHFPQNASTIAQKIIDSFTEPFNLSGKEVVITTSIGITFYPLDAVETDQLLKHADIAMYHAKKIGKNNFQYYSKNLNIEAFEQLDMEVNLRRALERDEFILLFQPQIDILSGILTGVEALIRWKPSNKAMVPPDKFISLAEETGLIVEIGDWVIRKACEAGVKWGKAGYPPIRIGVNLSARQFADKSLVERIKSAIQRTGILPANLELEITESAIMQDVEAGIQTLTELRAMGISLAIDDFGTGHSSLSYLKRFPVNTIKIDQSFIRDVTTDSTDAAIVAAIISMGQSMNLKVIAEGIEDNEHLDFLARKNCDEGQGYFIGKPMESDKLEDFIRSNNLLHSPSTN